MDRLFRFLGLAKGKIPKKADRVSDETLDRALKGIVDFVENSEPTTNPQITPKSLDRIMADAHLAVRREQARLMRETEWYASTMRQAPEPATTQGPDSSYATYTSNTPSYRTDSEILRDDASRVKWAYANAGHVKEAAPEEYVAGRGSAEDGIPVFLGRQVGRKERKFFSKTAECPECGNGFMIGDRDTGEISCPGCKHEFIPDREDSEVDVGYATGPSSIGVQNTGSVSGSTTTPGYMGAFGIGVGGGGGGVGGITASQIAIAEVNSSHQSNQPQYGIWPEESDSDRIIHNEGSN